MVSIAASSKALLSSLHLQRLTRTCLCAAGQPWWERRHLWEIITFFCYRITELGARIALLGLFAVCSCEAWHFDSWTNRCRAVRKSKQFAPSSATASPSWVPASPYWASFWRGSATNGKLKDMGCCSTEQTLSIQYPNICCACCLIRFAVSIQVVRGAWIFAIFGSHAVGVLLAIWLWPGHNQADTWWKVRHTFEHSRSRRRLSHISACSLDHFCALTCVCISPHASATLT